MSSKNVVPVLLLAGLALFLLSRPRTAAASPASASGAGSSSSAARINAIGQAVSGALSYLGGVTGLSGSSGGYTYTANASEATLDSILEVAKDWDKAYGGIAGDDGDPYWSI